MSTSKVGIQMTVLLSAVAVLLSAGMAGAAVEALTFSATGAGGANWDAGINWGHTSSGFPDRYTSSSDYENAVFDNSTDFSGTITQGTPGVTYQFGRFLYDKTNAGVTLRLGDLSSTLYAAAPADSQVGRGVSGGSLTLEQGTLHLGHNFWVGWYGNNNSVTVGDSDFAGEAKLQVDRQFIVGGTYTASADNNQLTIQSGAVVESRLNNILVGSADWGFSASGNQVVVTGSEGETRDTIWYTGANYFVVGTVGPSGSGTVADNNSVTISNALLKKSATENDGVNLQIGVGGGSGNSVLLDDNCVWNLRRIQIGVTAGSDNNAMTVQGGSVVQRNVIIAFASSIGADGSSGNSLTVSGDGSVVDLGADLSSLSIGSSSGGSGNVLTLDQGGQLIVKDATVAASGLVDFSGGTLSASVVVNGGGQVSGSGTIVGSMQVDGTCLMQVNDTDADLLAITGDLTLGVTSVLDVSGTVQPGTMYTLLSYTGQLTGTFGTENLPAGVSIDYGTGNDSAITLVYPPETCADVQAMGYRLSADLNEDCYVEWADFGIFASQWQQCLDPQDASCDSPWE